MAATHVFVNGVPLARGKFDLWMEGGGPQLVVDVASAARGAACGREEEDDKAAVGTAETAPVGLARPQSARIGRPATAKPPPPPEKVPENETRRRN